MHRAWRGEGLMKGFFVSVGIYSYRHMYINKDDQ